MTLGDFFVTLGIKPDKKSVSSANETLKGIQSFAAKTIGMLGIGISVSAMNSLAEEFDGINDSIRAATRGLGEQSEIQKKIMDSANGARESYENMARSVTDILKQDPTVGLDRAVGFAEQLTKHLKGSGMAGSEVTATQSIMNKVFAAGGMEVGTYTRMAQQAPAVINLLTQSLGVTREELQNMAKDGKVTNQVIMDAFASSSEQIQKNFEENALNFSDVMTYTRNRWGMFCAQIWDKGGVFNDLAGNAQKLIGDVFNGLEAAEPYIGAVVNTAVKGIGIIVDGIEWVGGKLSPVVDMLGGTETVLRALTFSAGAFAGAWGLPKILAGLGKLLGLINPVTIALLALGIVAEDIYSFMTGGDSLIGSFLQQFGIDADTVKKKFADLLGSARDFAGKVSKFLADAWSGAKNNPLTPLFEKLQEMGPKVLGMFDSVGRAIWACIGFLGRVKETLLGETFGPIVEFLKGVFLEGVMAAFDGVVTFATGMVDAVSALFDLLTGLVTGDTEMIKGAVSALVGAVIQILYGLLEGIGGILAAIAAVVAGMVTAVGAQVVTFLSGFKASATGFMNSIISTISSGVSQVPGIIQNGFQGAIDFLTGLPGRARQWGADFINGLIGGISETAGKVGGAAGAVADKIAGFLHFSRPDKGPLADYETWMPDMVSGMAKGLAENADVLVKQAVALAEMMEKAINPEGMMGGVTNNTSKSISQSVTINNRFIGGDHAAQTEGARAMDKAAKDATTYMAEALEFGGGGA